MNRPLLALAAASLLAAAAPAQDSQITITPYTPQVFPSNELLDTAQQLFGASLVVDDDPSDPSRGFSTMPRFVLLGDLLLVRESPEKTKKIVTMLELLEREELKRRKDANAAGKLEQKLEEFATQSADVRPRYVAFETLVQALEPFTREVRIDAEHDGTMRNVNPIASGGLIVLHESPARLNSLHELVDRIDQPRPQMQISVMLVKTGGGDVSNQALPKELVANLRVLLPDQQFQLLSVGMLRCSAQSGQQCELRMNLADGGNWWLKFFPEAYDARSGELSLSHCTFHCEMPSPGQRSPVIQDFDTSLTLQSGEYVVLGAVGAVPTFVVLRAEPVRKAQ